VTPRTPQAAKRARPQPIEILNFSCQTSEIRFDLVPWYAPASRAGDRAWTSTSSSTSRRGDATSADDLSSPATGAVTVRAVTRVLTKKIVFLSEKKSLLEGAKNSNKKTRRRRRETEAHSSAIKVVTGSAERVTPTKEARTINGEGRGQNTWMLWPVLGGDDGLSPTASPTPAVTAAVPPAKGVNKLTPLLLCAPCKPGGHRKSQSSTQWYVQQVKRHRMTGRHPAVLAFVRSASFSLTTHAYAWSGKVVGD